MKKVTYANKLAALLGIDQKVVEKAGYVDPKKKKSTSTSGPVGLQENQIQELREMQGLWYFLQAPELFSAKKCPHCGIDFLVSRPFVAFCSYTCIEKDFERKTGILWKKGQDPEALAKEVYEGNEPIWVRNLDRIRKVLNTIEEGLLYSESQRHQAKSS